MKKTMGKLKQALSIVLAAAMIVTCLPQTGMPVMAAEDQSVESSDEPDVSIETAEDEKNDLNESADAGDEAEAEEKEEITIPKYDAARDVSGGDLLKPIEESTVELSVSGNNATTRNGALSTENGSESYSFEAKANEGYEIAEITATATVSGNDNPVTQTLSEEKIKEEESTDGYKKYTVPLTNEAIPGAGGECANITGLAITVETKAIPLGVEVSAAEGEVNYSVDAGDLKDGKQYFTVKPDDGYLLASTADAVKVTKDGETVKVTKDGDKYYVAVDKTYGKYNFVVTASVVKAVAIPIEISDNDGVKKIEYTTAATDWKEIDVSVSGGNPPVASAVVTLESGKDLKIRLTLDGDYKAVMTAGKVGEEKVVTPTGEVYTVGTVTDEMEAIIITVTPIEYTIETVIAVDGKNVTAAQIEEIEDEIEDSLIAGYEDIDKSLLKGADLELALSGPDSGAYSIKSVQCKVGSAIATMDYVKDEDTDAGKYVLTKDKITKAFPKLQDGNTITVVINMEKAWKVTFDLSEGVTVKDASDKDSENWEEITEDTLYVKKSGKLYLVAEINGDDDDQLREAWHQVGTKKTDIKSNVTNGSKFMITVTADTIVTIKSTAKKYYSLTFNNENSEEIVGVSVVNYPKDESGNDISGNDLASIAEGTITSKNKLTFKLDTKTGYKTPVVTVEENWDDEHWNPAKTLTPTKGVYELTSLTANSRITIAEADLDEKNCNVLNINPASPALSNAYTATLTVSGNDPKEKELGSKYTYLAPLEAAEAVLTITPKNGYENLKVELKVDNKLQKTVDVTGNDSVECKITFTGKREVQNITVSAAEKAAEDDTTVKFANTAPHMSYKVDIKKGSVEQVTDGKVSNTYEIKTGGGSIGFTVTAANAYYTPEVTVNDEKVTWVSADAKKRTYTYSIAARNFNSSEDNIIYIQETSKSRKVYVGYVTDAVKVSADVGGGTKEPDDKGFYSVTDGDTINFKVSVEDNYKLVDITARNETTGKETKVTKNSISVKADADYVVTVHTQPLTAIEVYAAGSETALPMNKNKTYSVQYGTNYVIKVKNGKDQATLKYASFEYETKSEAKVNKEEGDDAFGTVNVKIDGRDANGIKKAKQLKLTLKDIAKKEYTVTLELLPLAGVKKVDGVKVVKKENILTQTVNTTKSYAITMNPATAAVTLDAYVVEENAGVTAEVKGKTLVITTAIDSKVDNLATVVLFDKTAEPGENGKKPDLYRFKVSTALPALPTPTVALQSADDTTLTLTLGAKNLALPDEDKGKVYYKVEVTPDTKATNSLKKEQQDKVKSVTEYFEVEGKDGKANPSQTEEVKVITAERGKGFAHTFDVTVTLVQSKKGLEIGKETTNEEANALTSSKSAAKKRLKTKAPAYATKITFKKGASAVYTNQKDVLAATAVFDKNATYTTLADENSGVGAPEDLSYSGDKALDISIDGSQILVSATSETAIGKHVIRVTAEATNTMRRTTADYTVTVARAIEKIELDAPIVYKAAGKAASFTVGITYNEGMTQPKTKKVNWTITNKDGKELSKEEARGVTVKNGKVTIPKDYILTEPEEEHMRDYVYVTATAADVASDNPVKNTVEVYIYNQEISVGETILVKKIDESGDWKVIARSGETVKAEVLKGASIAVLKKGTVDKESYTADEMNTDNLSTVLVPVDMTYKVNNKAIVLDHDYITDVNNGGLKKVTITATMADGSNRKSELKNLTVDYHTPKAYGLKVRQMTPWEEKYEDADVLRPGHLVYNFNGALDTKLELRVMELLEDWTELSAVSNYTLAVTGASILEKNVVDGTYTIIGSKADITVKLTDKTKKTNNVTTYTLHNTSGAATAKAPTMKAKTKGDLIAGKYRRDQQIMYDITGLPTGVDKKDIHVLITLDAKDSNNVKNKARYADFEKDCNEFLNNTSYTLERLEKRGLVFGTEGNTTIPAGTYKLTVNFGIMADEGNSVVFKAIAKPVTLTVKASAPKISAKLNSEYTLSINNAAAGAALKLNNDNVELKAVQLANDNVNGTENRFTEFFEIKEKGGTFVLRLRNNLSIEQLDEIKDAKKAKNDLTGWVTYTYDTGIFGTETVQAQIKVKGYTEATYTIDSSAVVSGNDMRVELIARANGNRIPVAFAYTNASTLKIQEKEEETVKVPAYFEVSGEAKNQDVWIVPATSAYTDALEKLRGDITAAGNDETKKTEAEGKYIEAIKKGGVNVKITVNVKETIPTEGYIEVDTKSLKATFNRDNYWVDDTSGNDPKGKYRITIPFTKKIVESMAPTVEIKKIKDGKVDCTLDSFKDVLSVDMDYAKSELYFDLVKDELEGLYGKTLTVLITVERPYPNEENTVIADSFTFALTLPKGPVATTKPQDAIDDVSGNAAKLSAVELENWQVETVRKGDSMSPEEQEQLKESIYFDNAEEVEKLIEKYNEPDSDIVFKLGHWVDNEGDWEKFIEDSFSDEKGAVTFPSSTGEGSITYTVTWTNRIAGDEEDPTGKIEIVRKIAKLPVAPEELGEELKNATEAASKNEELVLTDVNRGAFSGKLANVIRAELFTEANNADRKHLRVSVGEYSETPADPESQELPTVTYKVTLRDVKYGSEIDEPVTFKLYTDDYSESIRKTDSYVDKWIETTKSKIEAGEPIWLNNNISTDRLIDRIKSGYDENRFYNLFGDTDPVPELEGEFTLNKKASKTETGEVTGTITVGAPQGGKGNPSTHEFTFTIPLMKHDISDIVKAMETDYWFIQPISAGFTTAQIAERQRQLKNQVVGKADLFSGEDNNVAISVAVKEDCGLRITKEATTEEAGTAEITFIIAYGGYEEEQTFTFVVPQLEEEAPETTD